MPSVSPSSSSSSSSRLAYGIFVLVGLLAYLQLRLQAVLNAATRLVFRLRRYDQVTDALAYFTGCSTGTGHLQSGAHGILTAARYGVGALEMLRDNALCKFTIDILTSCLNRLVPVSDLPGRRRLRSSSTFQLLVPPYRLTTIGVSCFLLQPPSCGILCLSTSNRHHVIRDGGNNTEICAKILQILLNDFKDYARTFAAHIMRTFFGFVLHIIGIWQ